MKKSLKIAELFAGVGGFRLAFERIDKDFFKTVYANQWEPGRKIQFAYDCYISHFGKKISRDNMKNIYSNEDISEVNNKIQNNPSSIPDFDLIVGGFPCQDYSVASTKAKGIRGKKGVLWWEIERMIRYKNPKYLLLENVDRLLKSPSNQRGRDFLIMLKTLTSLNFNIEWNVINAHDYGHVQKRKRVYIFAWKKNNNNFNNIEINKTVLTENFKHKKECINNQVLESKYNLNGKSLKNISENEQFKFQNYGYCINGHITTYKYISIYKGKTKLLKDILINNNEVDSKYILNKDQMKLSDKFKDGVDVIRRTKDGYEYRYKEGSMYRTEPLERYARTMLTSEGTVNRSSHIIEYSKKPLRYRFITPLEAERIQEFDDNWTIGMPNERNRYFVMGNALVVGVIEKIAKSIKEKLL